jgi:hypothetical protein
MTGDVGDSGDLPLPSPLPVHPTPSQVIPDWRRFGAYEDRSTSKGLGLVKGQRLRANGQVLPITRFPDHRITRSRRAPRATPTPPGHPRLAQTSGVSSQVIPDWRRVQRCGLNWRGFERFRGLVLPNTKYQLHKSLNFHRSFSARTLVLLYSSRRHSEIQLRIRTS